MPNFPYSTRALLAVTEETAAFDFKAEFDPESAADWCELLKDIFSIANIGGGGIIFGVNDAGGPSGADLGPLLSTDVAKFCDKIYSYTGVHFGGLQLSGASRAGSRVACLRIAEAAVPLIPTRPGTYATTPTKQHSAFSKGMLLVRHGPKSEPGTSDDLAQTIQKRVQRDRRLWIGGLRRVVEAPVGSTMSIVASPADSAIDPAPPPAVAPESVSVVATDSLGATAIRITSDPAAPSYKLLDPDRTHPYRMLTLLGKVNAALSVYGVKLSAYDIKVAGVVYGAHGKLEHCYKSEDGPRKYSPAFVDWLVENCKRDRLFFKVARSKLRRLERAKHR
jgi:hypothetical protein